MRFYMGTYTPRVKGSNPFGSSHDGQRKEDPNFWHVTKSRYPQLITYLENKFGDDYNYWIIECVFRDFESSQNAAEGVGGATHVECNVEEKTKPKKKVQKVLDSDGNTVSDFVEEEITEEQILECYKIDSVSLYVAEDAYDGRRRVENWYSSSADVKWTAQGHFSVDVSRLSKFAKEHSRSIAGFCENNQDDWEYEVEFIGKGNEISVSIKPVEPDEIPSISKLRYSMRDFVERLLYS